MSYRPYLMGATVLATSILMASLVVYAASPNPQASQDAPQKSSAAQSGSETKEIIFKGICDGSAAVKLKGDKILVAYDEENALFVFDTSGGMPTAHKDLQDLNLKTFDTEKPGRESDIEAAAVAGERIWWLGSHSRSKKGKKRPNRRMLFATNIPSPDLKDLKIVEGPLDLKDVLEKSDELELFFTILTKEDEEKEKWEEKSAWKQAPLKGGVSIEGLATSADGGLLLGFRSPLSGKTGMSGKALVVKLMPEGNTFKVEKTFLLDLGDRGVRDLVNDGAGYMILAGPVERKKDFALYAWNGSDPPKQIGKLAGLNAEALVDLGNQWLILSDDGKVERSYDGGVLICDEIREEKGKDHPSVYFRAQMIPK